MLLACVTTRCCDATKRRFDVVMAWSVDRLGRSLRDLIDFLSEIHALGIDLFLHRKAWIQAPRLARLCFRCSPYSVSLSEASSQSAFALECESQE
jgi:hypothetical protein